MRVAIQALVVVALLSTLHERASACSCILPSIENSYQSADHVLRVRAIASLPVLHGQRYFLALITAAPFKGCLHPHSLVIVQTAADSASCGINLQPGSDYLLFAGAVGRSFGIPVVSAGLCNGNMAWADVTPEQSAFLSSREVCCGKGGECRCYNDDHAECFADPCQVSSCDVEGAVCNANYCAGCHAEWTDADGYRVCLPSDTE